MAVPVAAPPSSFRTWLALITIVVVSIAVIIPVNSFQPAHFLLRTAKRSSSTLATGPAAEDGATATHSRRQARIVCFSSANNDDNSYNDDSYDWGLEDEDGTKSSSFSSSSDPRLAAMRTILESSWDVSTMGNVPTTPRQAAIAAVNGISNAIQLSQKNPYSSRKNNNILMVDVRLPSYDITEGYQYYDPCAVYDLASFMAEEMHQKKLVNKCLILVRNESERIEIVNNIKTQQSPTIIEATTTIMEEDDTDDFPWEISDGQNNDISDDVDDFRKKLMTSWISTDDNIIINNNNNKDVDNDDGNDNKGNAKSSSEKQPQPPRPFFGRKSAENTFPNSHRLWSMIGNEDLSNNNYSSSSVDDDTFHRIISAVDSNARLLDDEDAIILLSPYTTNDIIAIRRILARYCGSAHSSSTTVILVNSRLEVLPKEMDSAVLVYGILPLVARSKQQQNQNQTNVDRRGEQMKNKPPGLKAVVMKRYPNDWTVYVDMNGDGFVEATTKNNGMTSIIPSEEKQFPSPEWISRRVQAHVEWLTREGGGGGGGGGEKRWD